MNYRKNIPARIRQIFQNEILPPFLERYDQKNAFIIPILNEIERIAGIVSGPLNNRDKIEQVRQCKQEIYTILNDYGFETHGSTFLEDYPSYLDNLEKYLESLPGYIKEEQSAERFIANDEDPWQIRYLKYTKYFFFKLSRIPRDTGNMIRKIRKKEPRPWTYWDHKIYPKSLSRLTFRNEIIDQIQKEESNKFRKLSELILSLKDIETKADLDLFKSNRNIESIEEDYPELQEVSAEYKKILSSNVKQHQKELKKIFTQVNIQFQDHFDKCNTLEFPSGKLKDKRLDRQFRKVNQKWKDLRTGWNRTFFALLDDWKLDIEINRLKLNIQEDLIEATNRIWEIKNKGLDQIYQIEKILDSIDSRTNSEKFTRKEIVNIRQEVKKNINEKYIKELLEILDGKILVGITRNLEINLEREIRELSGKRALVKTELYKTPLKDQDLNYILPNELISFEVLPKFYDRASSIKNKIFNQLEGVVKLIPDIDNIISFSLDTVLNYNEKEDEQIEAEHRVIIQNGITRTRNRINESREKLTELFDQYADTLIQAVQGFNEEAIQLTQNENALEIRLKLIRAKALMQSRAYRKNVWQRIKDFFSRTTSYASDLIKKSGNLFVALRKKYFFKPSDVVITREISDFLSESKHIIDKLPIIYRKLYEVEPIADMELFIGREDEFVSLKSAYQHWINERASSVLVVGEKGGGISSFLNYSTENIKFSHPHIRIDIDRKFYRQDDFITLLSEKLNLSACETPDDFIKGVNQLSSKKIVIIENIQHIYLRSVNGFESLKSLFEILSGTYEKIFWISTSTQYAGNYLDKSIQIKDHFHQLIELKKMEVDEINSVIRKRNQIGGFRILFQPTKEISDSVKFRSMKEEDQQQMLEKRFFKRLNDFAGSNISMALLFWLLSTKKVTDDQILVGDFHNPDPSFLQVMDQNRIYILLALILHDGLNIGELSLVDNEEEKELRLDVSSLVEDGIIVQENDRYLVNPLIYRNVVSILKLKNLIH